MYSLIVVDDEEIKKAKGVRKMLLKTGDIKNFFMSCLIKKMVRQKKEFKEN